VLHTQAEEEGLLTAAALHGQLSNTVLVFVGVFVCVCVRVCVYFSAH
jgi:hypothetical protein